MNTLKVDLLFNVLLAITLMFLTILLILKTEDSKPAVEDKNRLIITTEWEGTSDYDIDMWIKDPAGRFVGYAHKNGEGIVLQRDDTGFFQDKVTDADGNESYVPLNREIINIRKLIPGRYTVNVIVYSNKFRSLSRPELGITYGPVTVVTDLIQADPFAKWSGKEVTLEHNCQQATVLAFDVSADDKVTVIEDAPQIQLALNCSGTGEDMP